MNENFIKRSSFDPLLSATILYLIYNRPELDYRSKIKYFLNFSHQWNVSWSVGDPEHTSNVSLHHQKLLFGKFTIFSLALDAKQIGFRTWSWTSEWIFKISFRASASSSEFSVNCWKRSYVAICFTSGGKCTKTCAYFLHKSIMDSSLCKGEPFLCKILYKTKI